MFGSSYKDVFSLSNCEMFWKNDCIRQKLLEQLHSYTHNTQDILCMNVAQLLKHF